MNAILSSVTDGSPPKTAIIQFTAAESPRTAEASPEVARDTSDAVQQVIAPREQAYQIGALLLIGDWAVASAAIFSGLQVREWQRIGSVFDAANHIEIGSALAPWSIGGGAVFAWLMVLTKTYETANIYRMQRWLKNLIRCIVLWSVALWAYIGLFQVTAYTPRVGVVYCTATLALLQICWRLVAFIFLIQPRVKEKASTRVIVVGWNEKVAHLRKAMRQDIAQLREIIGCVPLPNGHFGADPPKELAILGDYSALPQLAVQCGAHSILLADCSCSSSEIQLLAKFCQRELLGFQMVPEYFPALNSGLQVQMVSGVPLLGVSRLPLDRTINRVIKRAVDVFGAITGLVLSTPIVCVFSLLVFFESPGPVFYWQRRTSRSGRTFSICKIRSMKIDAESKTGAVWCTKKDDRRLKIGEFMREHNIDELPQFWNVLTGDMSLVGPRPERPELIEKFKGEIPNYNARHEVRTGLTGWAQIHGLRGDTDLGKRIEADLYYLENWSVMLDFYCIAATFFGNKNAH
jgi:exopolysaccharide biosynthesis polyprenyl glycosylphosphotransferase